MNPNALVPVQRTPKGLKYEAFITKAREELSGMDSASQKRSAKANQDFLRGLADAKSGKSYRAELQNKAVTPGAVHVDTLLAQISVMYTNDEYIGERLMPAVPVSKRSDKFAVYPKRERFAFPDDEIGHRASPNELEQSRTTDNYSVVDRGFKNYLDLETVQNEDAPLNEMVDVVEQINEGIAFKREKRLLTILNATASYSGNTAGAGSVWEAAAGGSVITDILAATSALWSGPNPTQKLGFCSLDVWNTGIANNASLRELFKYTREGLVTQAIASHFGLDDILVSRSREDTANSGQTASYSRMMTAKQFGVVSVARRPSTRSVHFGSTFRMAGDPFSTQWDDASIGKRGGTWARVSVSEDHKIVAGDAGFLITGAIT